MRLLIDTVPGIDIVKCTTTKLPFISNSLFLLWAFRSSFSYRSNDKRHPLFYPKTYLRRQSSLTSQTCNIWSIDNCRFNIRLTTTKSTTNSSYVTNRARDCVEIVVICCTTHYRITWPCDMLFWSRNSQILPGRSITGISLIIYYLTDILFYLVIIKWQFSFLDCSLYKQSYDRFLLCTLYHSRFRHLCPHLSVTVTSQSTFVPAL